jgi:hypothetical protein
MDIYVLDPASIARHHTAFWTALAATALLSAVPGRIVEPDARHIPIRRAA